MPLPLAFALDARADLHLLERRLDARRVRFRLRAHLAHGFLAQLLRAAALEPDLQPIDEHVELEHRGIDRSARAIHDRDPGHAGRERDRSEPKHEQQHGRAERAETLLESAADDLTENPARGLAHFWSVEVQRREAGARCHGEHEARAAIEQRTVAGQLLVAEQEHTAEQHEHREQVGGLAEQQERDVGEPCAGWAHAIRDLALTARDAESGIDGAVAQQRQEQDQAQARENPEGRLSETPDPRNKETVGRRAALGSIQVMWE